MHLLTANSSPIAHTTQERRLQETSAALQESQAKVEALRTARTMSERLMLCIDCIWLLAVHVRNIAFRAEVGARNE